MKSTFNFLTGRIFSEMRAFSKISKDWWDYTTLDRAIVGAVNPAHAAADLKEHFPKML